MSLKFTPCLSWVRQGVAKAQPEKVKLNERELEEIIQRTTQDIEDAEESEGENGGHRENAPPAANESDEYNFDDYDEETGPTLKLGDIAISARDTNVNVDDTEDADSENDDNEIKPEDNLILSGHVEDDSGVLEVYVYNEDEGYLYVHHDMLLPALPLCFEWLDHEPGNTPGNLVAVGSLSPIIEVWDLDIVDCLEAAFKLGQRASKKKHRKATGHKKSVLSLAWNKHLTHILASGSADKTVLLWDLDTGEASTKLDAFSAPVQSMKWHTTQGHGLLTGCCDKYVRLFDCRTNNTFLQWELPGEIERVAWNHFDPFFFLASTDAGSVHCFDARTQSQVWQIQKHNKGVTGLSLSCTCPGLLVTGGMDGKLFIWDTLTSTPELIEEKQLNIGAIHCVECSPNSPFVVSVGGDNKENDFTVWQMEESEKVKERFSGRGLVLPKSSEDAEMETEASLSMGDMSLDQAGPSTSSSHKKKHKK